MTITLNGSPAEIVEFLGAIPEQKMEFNFGSHIFENTAMIYNNFSRGSRGNLKITFEQTGNKRRYSKRDHEYRRKNYSVAEFYKQDQIDYKNFEDDF